MLCLGLAACSGSGSSFNGPTLPTQPMPSTAPSVAPSPSPSPTISLSANLLHASAGGVVGKPDMFIPTSGNTTSGGTGNPVDGISCDTTMSDNYHIHVFVGIVVNGVHNALPLALGMVKPGAPVAGFVNSAKCFYFLHTHDSSGIVHVESTNPTGAPITASLYTLKNLFDIWGITVDGSHVGQFTGPVVVMTSGQTYRGDQNKGVVASSTYSFYGGDPNGIPLYSHEVIWLMVGPTYPASLDGVSFYTQF
jgi:hypothetical protein